MNHQPNRPAPPVTKSIGKLCQINISNLRLRCIIGIFEWERKTKQDLIFNIEISYDSGAAVQSDSIEDAFDYKSTTKKIIDFVEKSSFELIETLADRVAKIVLGHHNSAIFRGEGQLTGPNLILDGLINVFTRQFTIKVRIGLFQNLKEEVGAVIGKTAG